MNLKQASRYLGVHYQTAYKLVRAGRLSAVRVGAGYEISEAALERYLSERQAIHRTGDHEPEERPQPQVSDDRWAPVLTALDAPVVSATTIVELVADALMHELGDLISVRLLSDDRSSFGPATVRHTDPEQRSLAASWLGSSSRPVTDSDYFERVAAGETVLIQHFRQDHLRGAVDPELLQYLDRNGVHSLVAVPAFIGDEVVALVGATRDMPGRPYTSCDVAIVTRAAALVAAGIERARLVEGGLARRRALVDTLFGIVGNGAAHPDVATALDDSGYGEIICDPSGHVLAINDIVARWFGYCPTEIVGRQLTDLVAVPDERDDESQVFQRLVHGELTYVDTQRTAVRHDGSPRRLAVRHAIVRNQLAEPRAIVVVAHELPELVLQ